MNYAVLSITEDLNLMHHQQESCLVAFSQDMHSCNYLGDGWRIGLVPGKVLITSSAILWSIFTGLTGAAWSLTSMIMIRFLFGIGEGGFQPASSKIISQVFPQEKRAGAMSIMLSSGGIIALIIPILSVALLTTIGWRITFVIMGVIVLLLQPYIGILLRFQTKRMRIVVR